jgi:hypothetical protein
MAMGWQPIASNLIDNISEGDDDVDSTSRNLAGNESEIL